MRTKEVNVRALIDERGVVRVYTDHECLPACDLIKARLIYECPVKSITITESEFDQAWRSLTFTELDAVWPKRFERLGQKLFKDAK
jgi:hypothetical protein